MTDTTYLKKLVNGYYWCSVGGNPLEPCEVTANHDRAVYEARTIGCPDPFNLLMPDCPLVLWVTDFDLNYPDHGGPEKRRLQPPQLPYHMGGEKPVPSRGHGWRGPRSF